MAVYYKFKSAKDYDSIPIDGHFISVASLKERIFESKHLGRGTDFDLVVTNAQTNEEYLDEATLIPKNTSVLIRRVPGRPRMTIVAQPDEPKVEKNILEDEQPPHSNFSAADTPLLNDLEESEWDDGFGNDLYATIPEVTPGQLGNPSLDTAPPSKADEDSKIKALIENSVLDWQCQPNDGFGGRGFGRGGRGGRGFGRVGLERKTPPQGYICHRCKIPGHFIQHCPTNGDPNYDIRKVKPPTGIPKSMLVPTPDGSYALPSGTSAVLKPNEAAFEKEIEGLPSTRSVGDLPPELHCPLCKEVMKDAVLTSKCCFKSFCDKCIRDYIISKSMCVCLARDILADDLLPNKTLRDTINRILESGNSSADNAGSTFQVQDMESARCPEPKIPSPSQSAATKGEEMPPPHSEEAPPNLKETINVEKSTSDAPRQQVQPQTSDRGKTIKVPDVSEATHESASVKEPASQSSAPPVDEEVQQKLSAAEAGKKKKKKKKVPLPINGVDMQWTDIQPGMDGFMGPSGLNPYWPGVQPAMDGFFGPFPGNMPYTMNYGVGPMDLHFGNMMPHDPFGNVIPQGFMFPPMVPRPQRDLAAEFGLGMNIRPPPMSREEFEARKAEVRRKREMERRDESREPQKDRDYGREVSSNAAVPPMKLRPKPPPIRRSPSQDRYELEHDRERERDRDRVRERTSLERYEHERDRNRGRERASLDHDRDRDRDPLHRRSTHSHRSDPISPDRTSRDPDILRQSLKRKVDVEHEYDHHRDTDIPRPSLKRKHDSEHDYDHHRDREREHDHREHHRRSESSSKPPPSISKLEPTPPPPQSSKSKPSVFSRISFPNEEMSKKRKVSDEPKLKSSKPTTASKDLEGGNLGSGSGSHRHLLQKPSSISETNGYNETMRKSVAAIMDYESSDDDRHFKRKPSRYEPSPPPREAEWDETDEDVEGRRHSRDRKHRETIL